MKNTDSMETPVLKPEQAKPPEVNVTAAGPTGTQETLAAGGIEAPDLEAQREEIESQRKALQREYLKIDTLGILTKNGLPKELLPIVMGKDLEETKTIIKALKEVFDQAVQRQVEFRMRGNTPTGGNGTEMEYGTGLADQVRRALV